MRSVSSPWSRSLLRGSVRLVLASAVVVGGVSPALAQLELPAASPAASVSQRVGLTDIAVEYSSPAVSGRKIWGALVPFDKPWRAGANKATKITFSRDVTFGGKAVAAGSYAIVMHPTASGWTVALNRDVGLWVGGSKPYDDKLDAARVPAATSAIAPRERMTFVFGGTTDSQTSLDLEWEALKISVPIQVDTANQAKANIEAALKSAWRPHALAARYIAETTKDYATALKYIDASLAIEKQWFNTWIRADILHNAGRDAEARKAAQAAWDLGSKDPNFFYKDRVAEALKSWKK